jgi:hypothetical protein
MANPTSELLTPNNQTTNTQHPLNNLEKDYALDRNRKDQQFHAASE